MSKTQRLSFTSLIALSVMIIANLSYGQITIDTKLPTYKKISGVQGYLSSIGSDTLNNLMTLWGESFKKHYPNIKIQIEGKGSSTAPPALIVGSAQLGPMSRKMKDKEIDKFEQKYGYKPTQIPVAIDALAIFINKNNPIQELSLKQLDSIFSSTYKKGGKAFAAWGDIGNGAAGFKNRAFSIYGRNSASGTYAFFKSVVLQKGDYISQVKEQPGSSAVVQGVAKDQYAIGYSGIGYKTSSVKAIAVSDKGLAFHPAQKNCINGNYPLARLLYIYVNKAPSNKMDKLTLEFIKFVLSQKGQKIVAKDGYYPLPASQVQKTLAIVSK